MPEDIENLFAHLTMAQALLGAAVVAGLVAVAYRLPVSALSEAVVNLAKRKPKKPSKEDGSTADAVLWAVAVAAYLVACAYRWAQ